MGTGNLAVIFGIDILQLAPLLMDFRQWESGQHHPDLGELVGSGICGKQT